MQTPRELMEYLGTLEKTFNPQDPMSLQALNYLFYANYTILNNADQEFTEKLLRLVEATNGPKENVCPSPNNDCCGPVVRTGPLPREFEFAQDPYLKSRTLMSEFLPLTARGYFHKNQ